MDVDVLAAFSGISVGGVIAASAVDVPVLLAALEAVLKLADDWSQLSALRAQDECASELRAAIAAALPGEEAGDGASSA